MASESLKSVDLIVAGRTYPVKLKEDEESSIRKLEKQVNDKIRDFKLKYKDLDNIDCLSMTLLTYAFDLHKANFTAQEDKLLNKLSELEFMLDKALS